jgi:hypothetical protein
VSKGLQMSSDGNSSTDIVAEAIARISQRAEARKTDGEYTASFETELDRHFRGIASNLAAEKTAVRNLNRSVEALITTPSFSRAQIDTQSRMPGGSLFHRIVGKLVSRQVEGIFQQLREHDDAQSAVLKDLAHTLELIATHGFPDTERRLSVLADRVAILVEMAVRMDLIEAELSRQSNEHGERGL